MPQVQNGDPDEVVPQGRFVREDLARADLTDVDLSHAVLVVADLTDGDLSRANLRERFVSTDLTDAVLSGANLYGLRSPPPGILTTAVHGGGAVCFEEDEDWSAWLAQGVDSLNYPTDEGELYQVCGVSVETDSLGAR